MNLNKIGKWKISILETGNFKLDGGAMMGSVPKVLWEQTNSCDSLNRIDLSMRCLLLDDGENVVLIESGIGDKTSSKFKNMYDVKQSEYALSNTLAKYNYCLEDITHVILTHLHFDHAGGATKYSDSNEIIPTFPNAKYYVSKRNWESGLNPNPKDRASYLSENYLPLQVNGVLELISDNVTILNGIDTYVVHGHTYGQQLIKISDNNNTLIFCSDLIPLKSHIKIPWIMGYDLNASLTLKEKELFLKKASENQWILFFYHDPKVIAVKIRRADKFYEVVDEYRI